MSRVRISLIPLLCVFLCSVVAAPELPGASGYWKSLRARFPYHIQTIVVSPKAEDGTRFLIVAEPPPHVTLEGFKGAGC